MNKEKFHIPMPDEQIIEHEISEIVKRSLVRKQSFFSFLKEMWHEIGLRHLFSDRTELLFILFTASILIAFFLGAPNSAYIRVDEVYSLLFLISPLLFIALSIFGYVNKIQKLTYEVEMTCRYHVYQVLAFRMLVFSVFAILFNTFVIMASSFVYEDIHILRAFMISTAALFSFSSLFLFVLMKRRSTLTAGIVISGWVLGNLFLRIMNNSMYKDFLVSMPLFIYAIVIISSFYLYIKALKRFVHFNQPEGV